jgi:hypothetical protein
MKLFYETLPGILNDLIVTLATCFPISKSAYDIIHSNHRPYILLQVTVAFKMVLNVDK